MRAEDLLDGIGYTLIWGSLDTEICDIVDDSRQVEPGALFVCIKGCTDDGHNYIHDALRRGAAGVVITEDGGCKRPRDEDMVTYGKCTLAVRMYNHRESLGQLCNNFWDYPSHKLTVIAVTGTKGKTTVSYMMKGILERSGCKTGLIGTIEMYDCRQYRKSMNTTPGIITLHRMMHDMVSHGARYCVMEVSSQGLMAGRVEGIDFDIGIYTNVTPDHIGRNEHKTFEEYVRWKSILFSKCRYSVINLDDMYASSLCHISFDDGKELCASGYGIKCLSHELYEKTLQHMPLYQAKNIANVRDDSCCGMKMDCVYPDKEIVSFKLNMPGMFNVYNALAVISAADILKIPRSIVVDALADIKVRGRLEPVRVSWAFQVYIDYAHNPVSLEQVLATLRPYCDGRLMCVFGCGGNRAKNRRKGMGIVSGHMADLTIITNDNPRTEAPDSIMDDIESGLVQTQGVYMRIQDRKEAIRYAFTHAEAGDIVLLAGKGHEDYQEILGHRFHMDERELIKEIMEEEDAGVICGCDN